MQLWIAHSPKRIALAHPIEPMKLADFCLKNKEDHLQNWLIMNIEVWQEQEETRKSLTVTYKQNRRLIHYIQTTEQAKYRSAGQPTLRTMERPTWCTYERGNPRVVIFGHEIRSQDPRMMELALTEPTITAPRSLVRLIFDNG